MPEAAFPVDNVPADEPPVDNNDGPGTALTGSERVERDAAGRGLSIRLVRRPEARSLHESAERLGIDPSTIVKSLVVKRTDDSYLFALIPGGRKISWAKLRAVVGANRLSMPEASAALTATGFERGTITPLGSSTAWPVFADATVRGREIAMGSGDHGFHLFTDADPLLASLGATVADISELE